MGASVVVTTVVVVVVVAGAGNDVGWAAAEGLEVPHAQASTPNVASNDSPRNKAALRMPEKPYPSRCRTLGPCP